MENSKVIITYLYNSGFALEIKDRLLIFDYCLRIPSTDGNGMESGIITLEEIKRKKSVTVFVSHGHRDHFDAAVLRWGVKNRNISFVFSDDIPIKNLVNLIHARETIHIDGMQITAYESTDVGVSFFVEVDGINIFHAGDLNLWYRKDENQQTDQRQNKIAYRRSRYTFTKALNPLKDKRIDIAFFPVDLRIGGDYDQGALYFAKKIRPKLFVPMHFGMYYEACKTFQSKLMLPDVEVWGINERGQQYIYNYNSS